MPTPEAAFAHAAIVAAVGLLTVAAALRAVFAVVLSWRSHGGGGSNSAPGGKESFGQLVQLEGCAVKDHIWLTAAEKDALATVRQTLRADGWNLGPHLAPAAESEDVFLLRFLRARKFHVARTLDMLRDHLDWRSRVAHPIRDQYGSAVLGCPLAELEPHWPSWIQGFDRHGGPVMYSHARKPGVHQLLRDTRASFDALVKYHVWKNEQMAKLLGQQTIKLKKRVDKFTVILNADGWTLGAMSSISLSFAKALANMDQGHYPERLRAMVIINAAPAVTICWSIIKLWLAGETKNKVKIYGAEATWRPVLEELIGRENLPEGFGGRVPLWSLADEPVPCQTASQPTAADSGSEIRSKHDAPSPVRVRCLPWPLPANRTTSRGSFAKKIS